MNVLTRVLRVVMAVVMAILVLASGAAFAGEKQFILTVNPASPTASPGPFTFTFTNDGNSSFNSLVLTVPTGWSIPAGTAVSSSRGSASRNADGKGVTVNAINLPNGSGQSMTVTIATVTGTATCTAQSGAWTAVPWTGSSVGSGQTFSKKPSSSWPSTTIPSPCFTVTSSTATGNTTQGSITPLGAQSVNAGSTASFTITPATGYNIGTTTGTCGGTLTGNSFTTAAVNANCTVVANFSIKTFTVQGSPSANVVPASPTVNYNGTTSVTVTPPSLQHMTSASSNTCGGPWTTTSFTTGPVTANCTVSAGFAPNTMTITVPEPVVAGPAFNVSVTQDGPSTSVGLASSCGGTFTPTSTAGSTTTFTGSIPSVPSTGSCTLTASATDYPSQQKSFTVFTGILACGQKAGDPTIDPGLNLAYVDVPPNWGLVRGNNKDAATCVNVPYTFTLDATSTPQKASFVVPPGTGQAVSAIYVVVWDKVPVPTTGADEGWTVKRPKLAWAKDGSGNPVYVPALSCVKDPGAGFAAITTTSTPYALEDLMPVLPDFGTPYNTYYVPGTQAKMCVAQHGWTSVGVDGSGNNLVQHWTKVIDLSDGFMTLD